VEKSKDNEPKSFGFVTFAREHVAKDLVKQVIILFVSNMASKPINIRWIRIGSKPY
jgi:hypothetical protein